MKGWGWKNFRDTDPPPKFKDMEPKHVWFVDVSPFPFRVIFRFQPLVFRRVFFCACCFFQWKVHTFDMRSRNWSSLKCLAVLMVQKSYERKKKRMANPSHVYTLPETNSKFAPESVCLECDPLKWDRAYLDFREGTSSKLKKIEPEKIACLIWHLLPPMFI